jgi:hypothetical protein
MSAWQILLFPDPQPLVERLGRNFFLSLPETPGVYLMLDAAETVLYVGKAKNLKKRLGSYRVANPDRLPRRHLRMLRAVTRIELQQCADETSALARESELLRSLKPRFNRAGTWQGPKRFLTWRNLGDRLELGVEGNPNSAADRNVFGPMNSRAVYLRAALARLLWLALHPGRGVSDLPAGWVRGRFGEAAVVPVASSMVVAEAEAHLVELRSGNPNGFCDFIKDKLAANIHPFDICVIEGDLDFVRECRVMESLEGI